MNFLIKIKKCVLDIIGNEPWEICFGTGKLYAVSIHIGRYNIGGHGLQIAAYKITNRDNRCGVVFSTRNKRRSFNSSLERDCILRGCSVIILKNGAANRTV